jgi:hypothetical protein
VCSLRRRQPGGFPRGAAALGGWVIVGPTRLLLHAAIGTALPEVGGVSGSDTTVGVRC